MGHCIKAFIGKNEVIEKLAGDWLKPLVRLPQEFSLLFLTDDLFENITELAGIKNTLENQLEYFTSAVASLMEHHSFNSSIAYIETEYFGGTGGQGGVLYEKGKLIIPPTWAEDIINKILSYMGVYKSDGHDEFDSVQLGHYRHM